MSLLGSAAAAVRLLRQLDVDACLIGGLAVSVRCDPRFTRDVDLAVAIARDDRAEEVVQALDLRQLAALADEDEWRRAELAVQMIEQRGFSRGRDLQADLRGLRNSRG